MNTKEVISDVADRMGAFKKDTRELLLEHFRATVLEATAKGEKVRLAKFGTFYPIKRKRGESVKFVPAKAFLAELRREK